MTRGAEQPLAAIECTHNIEQAPAGARQGRGRRLDWPGGPRPTSRAPERGRRGEQRRLDQDVGELVAEGMAEDERGKYTGPPTRQDRDNCTGNLLELRR